MKKIIKSAILFGTGFLILQNSYCQIQYDLSESIKKKFIDYTKAVPREELYVHFDRMEYIAGEYLWFNIYLFDRKSSVLSENSRIAYFELLNSENRPVVQKRILLNKGIGPGQIVLPDSLSPGVYTIRAYTNWMKNFMPDNCYMRDIKIYNSFINKPFRNKTFNGSNILKLTAGEDFSGEDASHLSLKTDNLNSDNLNLLIESSENFRSENNNMICLFIETNGSVNRVSTERIISDVTEISVPKRELGTGVNHITVFNSKGHPVSEKFVYNPDQYETEFKINSDDSCSIRSETGIGIETAVSESDTAGFSSLSISITPDTVEDDPVSMKDYLIFGTEYGLQFQNTIKDIKLSELSIEAVNRLLSNVKSNWIDWDKILSEEPPAFKYCMEKEDHLLSGKIVYTQPVTSDSVKFVLMCSPGKEPGFQYSKPDEDGYFSLNIHIDESLNDLILMPDILSDKPKLVIESSFSDKYPDSGTSVDTAGSIESLHIQMYSANYQINKIYKIAPSGKPVAPLFKPLEPLTFYDKPDIGLVLSEYVSLPTMEEIFFELLPRVSLKRKKSGYEILIADRINDSPYILSPVLMIDGVKVKDASVIAELNPELVERIDIIKEIYLIGTYSFPGLINVVTNSGDYSCVPLDDNMTRLKYRVADQVLTFPLPDHGSMKSEEGIIPDFRNTLYWNPAIKPVLKGKSEFSFWTSDIPLGYIIIIQGVSPEGKPVFLKKRLSVFEN